MGFEGASGFHPPIVGGGTIGGGGTLNYVAKFTPDGSNIGDSLIFDNGTSVSIGTAVPDASALFELSSTSQGFLAPRMTTAQRNAIGAPAVGLFIYNLSSNFFNYWDGLSWIQVDTSTGGDVSGSGTTNNLPLWTDGPNSVLGDSIISQDAGATYALVTGNLGVGVVPVSTKIHVQGINTLATDYGIKIEDSASANLFSVRNDGYNLIGANVAASGVTNILSLGGQYGGTRGQTANIKLQTYNDGASTWGIGASSDGATFGSFEFHIANVFGDYAFYQGTEYCFWMKTDAATGGVYGAYLRRQNNAVGFGAGYFIQLNDSLGAAADYASVNGEITDNTAGAQTGRMVFYTATAGALTEKATILTNGNFGIGIAAPTGRSHVSGVDATTLVNQRLEPVSGVTEDSNGATVNTTDATDTTLQTIAIPTDTIYMIEAHITCKKTAGAGIGTVGDGNGYVRTACYANIGGVVTLSGAVQTSFTGEGIGGFNATLAISGTDVLVRVTGAINDNVTWNTITKIYKVA